MRVRQSRSSAAHEIMPKPFPPTLLPEYRRAAPATQLNLFMAAAPQSALPTNAQTAATPGCVWPMLNASVVGTGAAIPGFVGPTWPPLPICPPMGMMPGVMQPQPLPAYMQPSQLQLGMQFGMPLAPHTLLPQPPVPAVFPQPPPKSNVPQPSQPRDDESDSGSSTPCIDVLPLHNKSMPKRPRPESCGAGNMKRRRVIFQEYIEEDISSASAAVDLTIDDGDDAD